MNKLKSILHSLWGNDAVRRVVHTAWQVGVSTLVVQLSVAHSSSDVKAALVVTGATVLSAVKALLVSRS